MPSNSERCDGCNKFCTFNAVQKTHKISGEITQTYYLPTHNNEIIKTYIDNNGKEHRTICKTSQEALELAKYISKFCCYHKSNVK